MNIKKLHEPNIPDFSRENKIYIKDNVLKIGKPEIYSITNLSEISKKLQEEIGKINNVNNIINYSNLLDNLNKINAKIEKRNERIEKSTILKTIDAFLKFISKGSYGLTINTLNTSGLESYLSTQPQVSNEPRPPVSSGIELNQQTEALLNPPPMNPEKSEIVTPPLF